MYTSGPPGPGSGRLAIRRVVRRAFAGPAECTRNPDHGPRLTEYLSDLARPYRTELRHDLLDRPSGHSYGEMASAVAPGEPVDLVVLAYAVPDVRPGRATATYLSHVLPGGPLAFAVCDQGSAAAFTGLRLIRGYARDGACRRALLIVLEQATLHYEPAAPAAVPDGNVAVAVLCEESAAARVADIQLHRGVTLDQAYALLAASNATTVIAGAGLAELDLPMVDRVRRASPGRPFTGVWWELADELSSGQVLLAEYDEKLGYLCTSTIDSGWGRDDARTAAGLGLGASG